LHRTVAELQTSISSREFTEWIAFYNLDPFGAEREDLRAALVAATIANTTRGDAQDPYTTEQFMPKLGERALLPAGDTESDMPEPITPEQGVATLEMLNAMFGGQDLRKRER